LIHRKPLNKINFLNKKTRHFNRIKLNPKPIKSIKNLAANLLKNDLKVGRKLCAVKHKTQKTTITR